MSHIKTEKEVFGGISQFVRDQCSEGSDFEYLFASCLTQLKFRIAFRISYRQNLSTFKHVYTYITPSLAIPNSSVQFKS
jgi:hypothetical protein